MEKIDPYKHKETYEAWKEKVKQGIPGISKENSDTILQYLLDMEMGINVATSGVISMIMGIGIDFGIQIITRFKQELKNNEKREAMRITINGIFMPMFITTLAALIGFRAMSLGQLKLMGEMGTIMSLGVAFCMLAAITIVPSILVLFTKEKKKNFINHKTFLSHQVVLFLF